MVSLKHFSVFAVEDTTVQLSWGDLGPGPHRLSVGDQTAVHDGEGAGTALFMGLAPTTRYDVVVDGRRRASATTLTPPPGALVARIATVSDCHLFERGFGAFRKMTEPADVEPYAARCLRAALAGAAEWGAELLVVKGDLTQYGRPSEVAAALKILQESGLSVVVVPGNHEVKRSAEPWSPLLVGAGIRVADRSTGDGVIVHDLPSLRVIGVDTAVRGHNAGTISSTAAHRVLTAVAKGGRPVLLCLHHQLEPLRVRLHHPPGIPHAVSMHFLDELAAVSSDVWITSGHTHRCRARRHGPIVATEVGSTKDGVGGWAGYAVHEGGMRQVVRRVTGDGTDEWLDRTRRAVGGVWGLYAPGRLGDRCLTHSWTGR